MSGICCVYLLFIHHYDIVSGGGLLFPAICRELCNDPIQTINAKPSQKLQLGRDNSDIPQGEEGDMSDLDMPAHEPGKPLPLRSVLTKPVVITIINHAMFALLSMVAVTYIPLVWSTPVEFGGLGLSPASIGLRLSVYGGMNGIFQFAFYPHLFKRFGPRNVFISVIAACAVIYIIFPFENLAVRVVASSNSSSVVWLLVILQLSALCLSSMGYGKSFRHTLYRVIQVLMLRVGSQSHYVLIHFICRSQQTVARCSEWPGGGGDVDSERHWTGCCGLAICVLPDA
jgi:hypothetical protein